MIASEPSMPLRNLYTSFNESAGAAFIAATQFATRRGWVRRPSYARDIEGAGAFRYQVVRDFYRASPETHPVENAHEMVFDADGLLYLLTDHPANNVLVFGRDGQLARAFTFGMRGAHGLSLARWDGEPRLVVCDAYGARVIVATLEGEIVRTLPSPHELGVSRAHEPYQPTQTAVAPNGDLYVADGYGSQRVLQFDRDGQLVRVFGGRGRSPDALDYAHGIAIDARRGVGRETLLVTSRKQQCLKRFDLEGRLLGVVPLPGGYPCRPVIHGEHVYIGLCWSGTHLRANSGFVTILGPDDRVVATLGGHVEGEGAEARLVSDYTTFTHVHDVAVDHDGDLVACEWNAGHRLPVRLKRL